MSNAELMMGGFKLLVFGMGMVFAFLVLMIFCMKLLEKGLEPFKGALEAPPKPAAPAPKPAASADDLQLAAVAVAAVNAARR